MVAEVDKNKVTYTRINDGVENDDAKVNLDELTTEYTGRIFLVKCKRIYIAVVLYIRVKFEGDHPQVFLY